MKKDNNAMTTYVAFLRGINVGGNKIVKMETVKAAMESLGFQNVKTILASGNVLFETKQTHQEKLRKTIEETLKKTFGVEISVIVRTVEQIQAFADTDPFKDISITKETRLYVTFLCDKPTSTLNIPYLPAQAGEPPEKDFKILRVSDFEICSVCTVSKERGTINAMHVLEKEFGKNITTRNWNTIHKILKNS